MRLKLTLDLEVGSSFLPYNYHYLINGWVNKVLSEADGEFASFFHEHGYSDGKKNFKFFTFAEPRLAPYSRRHDLQAFELHNSSIEIILSFHVDEVLKTFIKGLFSNQKGFWANQKTGVRFVVAQIQMIEQPQFASTVEYTTLSPVLIKKTFAKDAYAQYLSPSYEQLSERQKQFFETHFKSDAAGKYKLLYAECVTNNIKEKARVYSISFDEAPDAIAENLNFELIEVGRNKLVHIKANNSTSATKLKTFHMKFRLTAPLHMHELIYQAGLGDNCSMGLGCLGILKG